MKKGQIAVWIVLAVFLIASLLLFFFFFERPTLERPLSVETIFDMQSFIDQCTRRAVNDVVEIMLPQGGFVTPRHATFFNNTDIEYWCINRGFYDRCINQHPVPFTEIEEEIRLNIQPRIHECFSQMQEAFTEQGGQMTFEDPSTVVTVNTAPDVVSVAITRKTTIFKEGETREFEHFYVEVSKPVYDLVNIVAEIASQEAGVEGDYGCYFEYVGYSILYPQYEIVKYQMSEPTKIYTITDKESRMQMNIAIRSCAIPAGS